MASELFFEFSGLAESEELDRVAVSILCVDNLVVTLHQGPLESLRLNPAELSGAGLELTMSSLVALLLLTQSARVSSRVRTVDDRVEEIDDRGARKHPVHDENDAWEKATGQTRSADAWYAWDGDGRRVTPRNGSPASPANDGRRPEEKA